jgi:hypothetical protein
MWETIMGERRDRGAWESERVSERECGEQEIERDGENIWLVKARVERYIEKERRTREWKRKKGEKESEWDRYIRKRE